MVCNKKILSLLTVAFLISGCALGSGYRRPEVKTPSEWQTERAATTQALTTWWERFNDPCLITLIRSAQKDNPTLDKAAAAIEKARAQKTAAEAGLFPSLNGTADATASGSFKNGSGTTTSISSGLDASWELDLFGKTRRSTESAKWPNFTLGGAVGIAKTKGTSVTAPWSFGPSLNLPFFDGGSIKAGIKSASADYESALAGYKQTVRDAVKDVKQALVRLDSLTQRQAEEERIVQGSGALSDQQISEYLANEKTAKANVDLAKAQLAVQKVTLSQTRIEAVDDGVITSRSALLGQVVSTGTELFRLQRKGRLEWKAEVDATQLPQVKPGAKSEITLPSGKRVEGTVRLVEPTLSTSTGRAFVNVQLPDKNFATSGMFAEGRIAAGLNSVLAVPDSAVVLRDGRSYVFEIGRDNKVVRRPVTMGRHRGDMVEISMGITENKSIVTSGAAFLADGDLVTVDKES